MPDGHQPRWASRFRGFRTAIAIPSFKFKTILPPKGRFQAGCSEEIVGVPFDVALGGRKDADRRRQFGPIALLSRSVSLLFFSSQYSLVTGIGSPESSPSRRSVSIRSSTLRF